MKNRYSLVRLSHRGGMYYCYDAISKKRESLNTKDPAEARRLLAAKNEAVQHEAMNLQIAQVYLQHSDPSLKTRTWAMVMAQVTTQKKGPTRQRYERAVKHPAFDLIRNKPLLLTTAQDFLCVLAKGSVSTNYFLRRYHNHALGMMWLPWPVLPARQWPQVKHKEKRAITLAEHEHILAREKNPEFKAFLQLLWHTGGSQSDVARLKADNVDWETRTISFARAKTGVPVVVSFGAEAAEVLEEQPRFGLLFPWLAKLEEKQRAALFYRRMERRGIVGVSLHSYRYAWAERAKTVGMPERYAQQALGHSSTAFTRAYSKKAKVVVPSLEEYEAKVIPLPMAVNQ